MTYADLKKLGDEQRTRLYPSLVDIYIQFIRLGFPSIGCLTRGRDGFRVSRRTVTVDFNMQEPEGLAPSEIQDSYYGANGILSSANDYSAMLLQMRFPRVEALSRSWRRAKTNFIICTCSATMPKSGLTAASTKALVLVHGDLKIFNLPLDDDMNLVSVLDWEWSRVIPLQFFEPPMWLSTTTIEDMSYGYQYRNYLELLDGLLAIMPCRERERYGNELLADEWNNGNRKVASWLLMPWRTGPPWTGLRTDT